jgi:glycosyltransferase involved in cell wall biosynthesis
MQHQTGQLGNPDIVKDGARQRAMKKNIGFIGTRFAGTDGVSLEASKWAEVLNGNNGHRCYWFAGELDKPAAQSLLVAEAHFHYPQNRWINERVFGHNVRKASVTETIHAVKSLLKVQINEFIERFKIDILIAQNALTIPMHVPLGVALTEIIAETHIPTIAHHHDFYRERSRFLINAVGDYLRMAFPPNLPNMAHVVINSSAQEELALRTGISSSVIPNVLDFENPPVTAQEDTIAFKESIGLAAEDMIILQPTRIVQRKGIEHAIALVEELNDPRCKLVISHEAGDEGMEYFEWLKGNAQERNVDLRLLKTSALEASTPERERAAAPHSLWDVYPHADFITYPSLYEGFGNAFLEAVYFRKPLLINRYTIFIKDIEPRGFDLVVMDGYLTRRNVQQVREILASPARRQQMVDHNYAIAARHFSYAVLRKQLNYLLMNFFGVEN